MKRSLCTVLQIAALTVPLAFAGSALAQSAEEPNPPAGSYGKSPAHPNSDEAMGRNSSATGNGNDLDKTSPHGRRNATLGTDNTSPGGTGAGHGSGEALPRP
ncbi:MAG TPA: hypothetical protein VN947_20705 [Polyangia bacterium]|nr:hypothetical protein [Polyangia bacterium]